MRSHSTSSTQNFMIREKNNNAQVRLESSVATTDNRKLPKGVNIGQENLGAQPTTT